MTANAVVGMTYKTPDMSAGQEFHGTFFWNQ